MYTYSQEETRNRRIDNSRSAETSAPNELLAEQEREREDFHHPRTHHARDNDSCAPLPSQGFFAQVYSRLALAFRAPLSSRSQLHSKNYQMKRKELYSHHPYTLSGIYRRLAIRYTNREQNTCCKVLYFRLLIFFFFFFI